MEMRHHGFSCSSLYTVTPEQAQGNLLINVAMPKSIAGTNRCKRTPTPSPIAIQTPILSNTMIKNRNRERTSFSLSRSPERPISPSTVRQPAAHNDDGGLPPQAGLSPCPLPGARQLGRIFPPDLDAFFLLSSHKSAICRDPRGALLLSTLPPVWEGHLQGLENPGRSIYHTL